MRDLLKRVYAHLPVPLQNTAISAFGYIYRQERFGGVFEATLAGFQARDRWNSQQMKAYVDAALRNVIRDAGDAPYYRERWGAAGLRSNDLETITQDSLHRLPVLKKEAVRQDPMAFVSSRGNHSGRLLTYYSSGSSGTPIRAICTRTGQQRFAAAREARSYRWAGTSIRHPRAMIGGQPIVSGAAPRPPFFRYNAAEKQVYFSAYYISPDTIDNYVEGFNRYEPESITGYAFSIFHIARLMRERKLRFSFKPTAVITSSEKLTTPMREVIADTWDCRAYEEYGSVENCGLATECEAGSMHVSPDFGVVEIVDDLGNPTPPGVEGRVLCTGLLNDAQFLVRYEIGDTAAWSVTRCSCGRDHLPVLKGITGRVEDVVVSADGRELVRFHGIFIDIPHVLEGQVIQEDLQRFRVRVIVDSGFGSKQADIIRKRFHERLGPVNVVIEQAQELERTSRGKIRAVISRLPR